MAAPTWSGSASAASVPACCQRRAISADAVAKAASRPAAHASA
ncbi:MULTISPECIES: hypothetical protein [Micromonospora]|nr:hypothetical protein [Micromonospora sp. NRRL B-16802]